MVPALTHTGVVPRQSLELVPDAAGRAAVREVWERLAAAGLPSQADHGATSNEVHLTLVEDDDLTELVEPATELLAPLLPFDAQVSGADLIGHLHRATAVLRLAVPTALNDAVGGLRAALPQQPGRAWLAHVTLARRLQPDTGEQVLARVGTLPTALTFSELRHWDRATRTLRTLL